MVDLRSGRTGRPLIAAAFAVRMIDADASLPPQCTSPAVACVDVKAPTSSAVPVTKERA